MLSFMAMLDPEGIPERLLRPSAKRDVESKMAIGTLDGFALISQEMEENYTLYTHLCKHQCIARAEE